MYEERDHAHGDPQLAAEPEWREYTTDLVVVFAATSDAHAKDQVAALAAAWNDFLPGVSVYEKYPGTYPEEC